MISLLKKQVKELEKENRCLKLPPMIKRQQYYHFLKEIA